MGKLYIKKSCIIGLDLSLTGTGVIVLKEGKLDCEQLIKSKPSSDRSYKAETLRLMKIRDQIAEIADTKEPTLALIEGLAFAIRSTTALVQLAGLNYLVREMLVERNIPFIIVSPTTLKKFITGSGTAKKDVMLLETFKRYGISFADDNLADGYALSRCGLALLGEETEKLTLKQQEVVKLLMEQL